MTNRNPNRKPFHIETLGVFSRRIASAICLVFLIAGIGHADEPKSAQEWFKRASQLYQDGSVDEAIGSLNEALKMDKDYIEALSLLGSAFMESGEFAKAVVPYHHAFELKPNDYSILLGYSNALEGAGRQEAELPVLKKLFGLNKSDMVTGIKYLTILEAAGREKYVEDYIALLEDLRKLPNFDPTYTAKLATAYNKTGNYPKAALTFEELLKSSPESSEYWLGLATAQSHTNVAAAKQSYQKAILYTDNAVERAKIQKASAALGSEPAKTVPPAAATKTPAAEAGTTAVTGAPVTKPSVPVVSPSTNDLAAAAEKEKAADKKGRAEAEQKAAASLKAALDKKASDLADKKAKDEAARLEREAAARHAKDHQDSLAQVQASNKAIAEANQAAKAEALRVAKEESTKQAKARVDALAQEKAEKLAAAEADQKVKAEAARLAKEELAKQTKAREDALAQAKAEKLAAAEADRKAKEEAARLGKLEADRLAKVRADSLAQAKAEKLAAAEADQKAKAEAARLAKEELAKQAKARVDALAQEKAEKLAAADADRKAKEEAGRLGKLEADRLAKVRADSLAQAKAEKLAAAETDQKAKAEAARLAKEELAKQAKARVDALAQAKAEKLAAAEADRKAKEEAGRLGKLEADRLAKVRADSLAQAKAEKLAAAEADRKAKAEADRLAKEEAAKQAKAQAEALAKEKAEKLAAAEADRKAKAEADRLAKEEAAKQAKARADSTAKAQAEKLAAIEADRKARLEEERKVKEEAARIAREEAARKEQVRADSLAKAEIERKAKAEADRIAKEEAAKLAREEAQRKAKAEAERLAQIEAERKAKAEAEQIFQEQITALISQQPSKLDTTAVLEKIHDKRAMSKLPDPRLVEAEAVIDFKQWNYRAAASNLGKLKVMSPSANRMMALSLFELQDYPAALKYFQKSPTYSANRADWGKFIKTLIETKLKVKAVEEYESYLTKYPDADDAISFLVGYYRQPLQKEKLIPKLELQLAKNPKDAALLTELIGLYDKTSPKVIEYRVRYLEVNPDDSKQATALAQAYEAKGNAPEALKIYQKLAKDAPSDKALNLRCAELLYANKQIELATGYFEHANLADPTDKKLALRLAGVYEESKKTDKASEVYARILEADPKDKAMQVKLFQLYSVKGDKDQIRALLMKIDDADPTSHQAQFQLAKSFLEAGDKEKAYVYLEKALRNQPSNQEYLGLLPAVVTSEDQVTAHFAALEKSVNLPGAKPELQAMMARGYAKRKNNALAAQLYAQAYAKAPKAVEGQREAIIALYDAKNFELAGNLAEKYIAIDDKDRVIREIEVNSFIATKKSPDKLREAIKGLSNLDPDGAAKWSMRLAQFDLDAKDTASAIEHVKSWLDKNPKDAQGWRFLLGLVAKRVGQEETYIQTLEKLVLLEPATRSRYDLELGNLYLNKGSFEDAEKSLLAASKGNPTNAQLWFKLGETEIKLRKDKDAEDKYRKAYQLDPKNLTYARAYAATVGTKEEVKVNLPLFRLLAQNGPSVDDRKKLAQAYFLTGDFANSAKEWDWLLKADSSLAATEPMIADAFMRSGQSGKARGLYERRLKEDPNNLQMLETIAAIYKSENNQAGYVSTLEKIVAVDPKYKGFQLVLATEKEKSKDFKGALEQYSVWVSRNSADLNSLKAMHRLADQLKDTTQLMDALVRLNREKTVDIQYKYQLAELDFIRSGNIGNVERLVKTHPDYKNGKSILVREYLRQNAKAKLVPFMGFLLVESKSNKTLLEPLADLYAMGKKIALANTTYHELLIAYPKRADIYAKVYKYSSINASPYLPDILRIGYESFPDDMDIKRGYAATLGKTPKALAIYQEILAKEMDVKVVARALDIALALQQATVASALLDKWINIEPKEPKVWEQALEVHTQLTNKPRMTEDLEQLVRFYPQRKEFPLQLGKLYEDQKQLDKATGMYQKALALDARNKAIQIKLVNLLTTQNRTSELQDVLTSIDKNDPGAHEAQFQLAKIYLAANDREHAYTYAIKAVKNQPLNAEYSALLPRTITSDQQILDNFGVLEKQALQPGARPELQALAARGYAKKKNSLMASRLFADVYAKAPKLLEGNRDAIVTLYDAKNYELSGSLAEKFLNTNSTDKPIREIQVNSYLETKKPAEKLRSAIIALSSIDSAGATKWSMRLAELDLSVRDTSMAILHSRQWLEKNPRGVDGWKFLLPLVAKRPGQEDVYIQVLEKLVVLEPANRARYDLELGNLYFDKGNFEEAEKSLSNAVKTSPANAKLWYRLGETEIKLHKDKESIPKFGRAYQLDPTNLTYARSYSRNVTTKEEIKGNLPLFKTLNQSGPSVEERKKLAISYFLNSDFPNSAKEWDWLLKADSSLAETEPMVSDAFMRSGQTAKARGLYEKRLVSDPNNLTVLETIAGIYKQEGNQKGYVTTVGRIVTVDPKYKGYQLVLAVEKEKAKDFKGALKEYAEWVVRNGDDEASLKSMHRLADLQKDTANLMDALVRLNRKKNVEPVYAFQMAEVDYVRSGNIAGIEKLVKLHPEYRRGKVILLKSYFKKGAIVKMVPFLPFLAKESKEDRSLAEPLGDIYAFQKKKGLANEAYFEAARNDKKDRELFNKVYKYAKDNESPYRAGLLKAGYEAFPDDVDLKFDYALTLGKTPKALDLYNEILNKDHNHLGSLRNGSEIAVALAKTDMAMGLLQRWVSLEPDQVRPWALLVDLYTQSKNDAKLAEALEKLSALTPKNGDLAYRAAMANKKIGAKDRSLELLTKAVALTPTNAAYQKEFGLTLFNAGQIAPAKNPLLIADRSIKNDEAINSALYNIFLSEKNKGLARERLRILASIKPMDKNYAFSLARIESELKSPAEAVRILEKPIFKEFLNAEMSFLLLDGYFKLGQKDRAAALGPQLIQKYPQEAKQSLPLAILFYETKNRVKAKEILETFVRNNPIEEAFYYLGKVYFDEKNWQGAINNLTRADMKRVDVLSMLGQSYISNKEPENAIKVYEDYYTKTKDIKVLVELYNLYKKTNDENGTRALLERLIAAEPLNYDYRVELAELYRTHGDIKKAESQYEMILKKMPTHPASNMNLGMILAARKDYSRSIKMLETGLAKYPDSATGWRYLGDGYRSDKRYAFALQAYKKAFKLQQTSLPLAIAKMQMSKELNSTEELPGAYADVIRLDSGNVEAASSLAEIRFEDRKYGDAAALYGRVTSTGKAIDKSIWANYGYALLETKRIDEAKRAFQRAVDLGEKSPRVMTSLARIYKEQGNVEKAETILSEMVKKDPRNHLAYYWLGQIASDRNQPGVAEDYFKKAQMLSPANPDYCEALARMSYNKDEFSTALKMLDPVKTSLSSAGRLMYGDCLMKMGRNDAALAEFNTVFAKDPSASVLAKLAELQINKGDNRSAIRTIEGSEFQQDSSVQFALAKARLASHELEKSRDILERLLRTSKYNASYYHYRGRTYFEEKNYSKAKKDFDLALKYNPDYMDAVYHIGLCLLRDGHISDAKNYFKELSQHSNASNQAKGFLGLAMAFESEKKYEAAENFLQKSAVIDESPEALSLWAKVLLKMRKPNEAEKHARRALELQPGNATAVVAMGDVLLAQNKKQDALALAKKSLEGNPGSCELLIGSAKINFAAGNYETSKSNSTYAISICPEEATPYYYAGVVADKKYLKKEAKDFFKAFRKHGGDEEMLPADYR